MFRETIYLTLNIIFNLFRNVNGSPASPTTWQPGNWTGPIGPGIDVLSIFRNNTASAHPTSVPQNGCELNCTRDGVRGGVKSWFPIQITATITAATVVHFVNPKRNFTRDVTITNTEADLTNFTAPSDTNSLGTRTFLVTDVAPDGVGSTTYPVAFPSVYTKYDPQLKFRGVLPTTISGTSTCLRATNKTTSSFPSHPTLAQSPFLPKTTPLGGFPFEAERQYYDSQNLRFAQDPKGWTWIPDPGMDLDVAAEVEQLFPTLGAWSCKRIREYPVAPATYLQTALYLTNTMTLSVGDDSVLGSNNQPRPAIIPLIQAARAAIAADRLAPSPVEARPTQAVAEPPLFSELQSALRVAAPVPAEPVPGKPLPVGPVPAEPVPGEPVPGKPVPAEPILGKPVPAEPVPGKPVPGAVPGVVPAEPFPVVTPGPQMQSTSNAQGLPRIGNPVSPPVSAPLPANEILSSGGAPPIEVGGKIITPNAHSQYIVSGQTLGVGSSITLVSGPSATVVGLQASGSQTELVVGSSTSILPPAAEATPPLTIGSQVYQANGEGQYIIGGHTLTPGGSVNVNGTPISLAPGATQLVVGSTTEDLEGQLPTGAEYGAGSTAGTAFNGMANARISSLAMLAAAPGLAVVLLLL